ncbi:MAG: transcription factor S [Candidatus Woesearchaeota archaeon]
MFCQKCGSIIIPKKENGKIVIICSKCGEEQKEMDVEIKEKTSKENMKEGGRKKEDIIFVDKETETHPLIETECPKCHNDKAYFWTQQTRASDEPETKFYKCSKCGYIWRDYS